MKKQIFILATVLVMLLAFAAAVNALSISTSTITIGSSSIERGANKTATFTVTNNDTNAVTVTLGTQGVDSKYNVRFSNSSFGLAAGESKNITITADIPSDHPAIDSNYEIAPITIGSITATAGSETKTIGLKMQAKNHLKVTGDVECGDSSKSLKDGLKITDLKPGDRCTIELTVKNDFTSKMDVYFDDDEISIDMQTDDSELEIDIDDTTLSQLDAGDDDTTTITIIIDESAQQKTYGAELIVLGRDSNGALHGAKYKLQFDVVREKNDIVIKSIDVSPSRVDACLGDTIVISTVVKNFGQRDEDDVVVGVEIPDLKLSKKSTAFELNRDSKKTVTLTLPIAAGTKGGVYKGTVTTYFKTSVLSNTGTFQLGVDACAAKEQEKNETTASQNNTVVILPPETTPGLDAEAVPTARIKSSDFTSSTTYLVMLGAIAVLAVIVIVLLLVVLFRKPKAPAV